MDGADQQHYLAGHDRLDAVASQLDADSPLVLGEDANDSLPVRSVTRPEARRDTRRV
jgi:hypothetical protein